MPPSRSRLVSRPPFRAEAAHNAVLIRLRPPASLYIAGRIDAEPQFAQHVRDRNLALADEKPGDRRFPRIAACTLTDVEFISLADC